MQKRWSINSMMLTFAAFSVVLIIWVLYAFKMGFGSPFHGLSHHGFFGNFIGKPGPVLSHKELQGQSNIPLIGSQAFPKSTLVTSSSCSPGSRDPDARLGARADQLQAWSVRGAVDHVRVPRQRS
jgi:hypothetical protein